MSAYRGRIAPSPTGYLHLGHARTFWTACERARQSKGKLVLRMEDLDVQRCKPEFAQAIFEDLHWFGLRWDEGPDVGGPFAPYIQSQRIELYREAFERLKQLGLIYPCKCSRQEIQRALSAPHAGEEEPVYPGTCRPRQHTHSNAESDSNQKVSWRFHVPDGETISFIDGNFGEQRFVAGKDFGDFIVWRHDNLPSYQLAVVVDDIAMQITEVVRGADLLVSTARQILLYRALQAPVPTFFHCALMTDENGQRLAKRHDSLSLRTLRQNGASSAEIRSSMDRR